MGETLGNRLRMLREKFHYTQEQLAVMATAVIATIWIPPLGIMYCIGTFLVSRKWKIHNIWLDILIFVCLGINAYYMYAILGHIVFDFGYGTVTPL